MTKTEARQFKQTYQSHKEKIAKVLANASAGCETTFPEEWTKEARKKFRRMAQAMLDFFAPVIDKLN